MGKYFRVRGKQEEEEDEAGIMVMDFPEDIVINEIILRLPVHALVRLKWVSKSWLNLINHPDFIKKYFLHLTRNEYEILERTLVLNRDGSVVYSRKLKDMFPTLPASPLNKPSIFMASVNPFGSKFEILGSCKGLIYLRAPKGLFSYDYNYFIWNPSTSEYKKLPHCVRPYSKSNYRLCPTVHGFGYDHTINDYIVVKIDHINEYDNPNDSVISRSNIYKLGSNSWSIEIENINPVLQARRLYALSNKPGLLVNESLHWLAITVRYARVICFDIVNKKHREMQIPPTITYDAGEITLQVLNDCLSICRVSFVSRNVELWMMRDYAVEGSWTQLFTIKGESFVKEISQLGNNMPLSYHLEVVKHYNEDGGILLVCNSKYVITYYPETNRCTIEKIHTKIGNIGIAEGVYVESLASVNSGLYLTDAGPAKTIPYIQGTKGEVKSKIQKLKFGVLGSIVK